MLSLMISDFRFQIDVQIAIRIGFFEPASPAGGFWTPLNMRHELFHGMNPVK